MKGLRAIQILSMLLLVVIGLLYLPGTSLKSEEGVTIDKLSYNDLIWGEDIAKEDLQDHVVGIMYWGKW